MKQNVFYANTSFIFLFVVIINLLNPQYVFAKDDAQQSVAEKLDHKRASFYLQKKALIRQNAGEMVNLKLQIKELKRPKNESLIEYEDFSGLESANEIAKGFAHTGQSILFPPAILITKWVEQGQSILYFLFLLTVINFGCCLYLQEREFFLKRKKVIYITGAVLFFLFSSPALVQADEGTDALLDKITATEQIIKLSPLEREIRILESYKNKKGTRIEIPGIKIKNPEIQPLETVYAEKWDYYYTLAALYIESGQLGLAVDNLNLMFAKAMSGLAVGKSYRLMIATSIYYNVSYKNNSIGDYQHLTQT